MKPTVRQMIQARPELRAYLEVPAMPEMIIGVNGKSISLMDATVEDLRSYKSFLDARVRRASQRRTAR